MRVRETTITQRTLRRVSKWYAPLAWPGHPGQPGRGRSGLNAPSEGTRPAQSAGTVPASAASGGGGRIAAIVAVLLLVFPAISFAQSSVPSVPESFRLPDLTSRENLSASMQILVLLTVLSLAPAIVIMTTSFTRIVIVLSLLRQALGTPTLPPNQVLVGLAMFMTFVVMGPTLSEVNSTALQPYLQGTMSQTDALREGQKPIRAFMIAQVEAARNEEDVILFHSFHGAPAPTDWDEVGTLTIVPGFMLSELKTAFLMGFKIYLPFLIIDMVIGSVLISMGMMMLPPALIALPFKLLLFVMVDGWRLITQSLMGSFVAATGSS